MIFLVEDTLYVLLKGHFELARCNVLILLYVDVGLACLLSRSELGFLPVLND